MNLLSVIRGVLFRRWGRPPLRDHLAITILVALLPMALLASYLLLEEARDRAERIKSNMERTAESLARSVDRELLASVDALTILARAEFLVRPDAKAVRSNLVEAQELGRAWRGLFVLGLDGKVVVDTQGANDKSGSRSYPGRLQLPDRTYWLIADPQRIGDELTFSIVVPIRDHSEIRGFLGTRIDVADLLQLLDSASPPEGYFYSLVDSDHRLIARTGSSAEVFGRSLDPSTVSAMEESISGVAEGVSQDGQRLYVGWRALGTTRWTVQVGASTELVESAFYGALYSAMLMGGTSLLLGMALALPLAQRVIKPLRALATRGPEGLPEGSSIHEIQQLRDALASAAEETRSSQLRLQSSADEFRALFEAAPIGLAFAEDTDCTVVRTNEAFDRMMNVPSGKLPDRIFRDGGRVSLADFPLCRAAATGASFRDVELEVESRDGSRVVVLANALPLLDEQGKVRGAIGSTFDITSRKSVESQLVESDRQLRRSQELMDIAQDAANVGFFHHRFDTDVAIWSPGHARLFGASEGAVENALEKWLGGVLPEDRAAVHNALREGQAARKTNIVIHYRVPSGASLRWVSSRITLTYEPDGRPAYMIGVSIDVTELKTAEMARAQLAEREQAARLAAEAANRAKDHFLGMLGHELRNPLSALTTAVAVLQRVERTSKSALDAEAIIARQSDHLRRLIDDLLDVARIVSGKISIERHPINLAELVRRSTETLAAQRGTGQKVALDLEDVWIRGDWVRIEQILNNLLGNAFKHSTPGETITVVTRRSGMDAFLEVIDEGPGIPPDLLDSIFEPFVQGDRTVDRRVGGLGIGLTVVRQLVQLHGGSVTAKSSGSGTVMSARFDAIDPGPAAASQTPPAEITPASPRTIVVIEDNEDARNALRVMLELEGHTVRLAETGTEGLELLLRDFPDIAIVDIGLPGLDGIDVAWQIRAAGYEGMLIAVSGYGQDSDRSKARDAGFDAHLVKPVSLPDLARLISEAPTLRP